MRDFIKKKLHEGLNEPIDTSKIRIKNTLVNNLTVFIPFYGSERMGAFRLKPFGENYKIDSTLLYDRYKGQGLGKGMYKYMISFLKKQGKKLISDDSQSPEAQHVWDSLVSDGFAVKNGSTYESLI